VDYKISNPLKEKIKSYCLLRGYGVEFKPYSEIIKIRNYFHVSLAFSLAFRFCSPSLYSDLSHRFNVKEPLLSQANGFENLVESVVALKKLFLNVTKPYGVNILYPDIFDYTLFGKLYQKNFKILDKVPELTYSGTGLPKSSLPWNLHFSEYRKSNYITCMECMNKANDGDLEPFVREFNSLNPNLTKKLYNKNIYFSLDQMSSSCCVYKTEHVEYDVEISLLQAEKLK